MIIPIRTQLSVIWYVHKHPILQGKLLTQDTFITKDFTKRNKTYSKCVFKHLYPDSLVQGKPWASTN